MMASWAAMSETESGAGIAGRSPGSGPGQQSELSPDPKGRSDAGMTYADDLRVLLADMNGVKSIEYATKGLGRQPLKKQRIPCLTTPRMTRDGSVPGSRSPETRYSTTLYQTRGMEIHVWKIIFTRACLHTLRPVHKKRNTAAKSWLHETSVACFVLRIDFKHVKAVQHCIEIKM